MPPKVTPDSLGVQGIITLCHVIMSDEGFQADFNKLAPLLSIAQAKNVPRKINSIIGPHGFEIVSGKVVLKDARVPATPADTTATVTPSTPPTKTPASRKKTAPKKAVDKTPTKKSPKKRKLNEIENEDDAGATADEHEIKAESVSDGAEVPNNAQEASTGENEDGDGPVADSVEVELEA